MELTPPKSVRSNGRDAYLWSATIGGIPHRIAWSQDDHKIRICWQNDNEWSRFVTLGPQWSPQTDLFGAQDAVERWATQRAARLAETRPESAAG